MKAISVIQPWAWLLASENKQFETRSWSTTYRGPIAIHASRRTAESDASYYGMLHDKRIAVELLARNIPVVTDLAYGAVIGTAELVACHPVEDLWLDLGVFEGRVGNFDSGRFAWELRGAVLLPRPVPVRGNQGLWEFDESLIGALA